MVMVRTQTDSVSTLVPGIRMLKYNNYYKNSKMKTSKFQ